MALVAHWKLDEGTGTAANDSVGAIHGTTTNGTWITGVDGGGLSFSGDGYIDFGDSLDSVFSAAGAIFSLALWVKLDASSVTQALVSKWSNAQAQKQFFFYVSSDNSLKLQINETANASSNKLFVSTPFLSGTEGVWQNLGFRLRLNDGGAVRAVEFFRNGLPVALSSVNLSGNFNTIVDTTSRLAVGARIGPTGDTPDLYLGADVDDVRLYDHYLSEYEFRLLGATYNVTLNIPNGGVIRDRNNALFANKTGVRAALLSVQHLNDTDPKIDWSGTFNTDANGIISSFSTPPRSSAANGGTVIFAFSTHSGVAAATGYDQAIGPITVTRS